MAAPRGAQVRVSRVQPAQPSAKKNGPPRGLFAKALDRRVRQQLLGSGLPPFTHSYLGRRPFRGVFLQAELDNLHHLLTTARRQRRRLGGDDLQRRGSHVAALERVPYLAHLGHEAKAPDFSDSSS